MRARKRIIVLSLIALAVAAPALADDGIVGIWSSVSRTKGGLGHQLIFTKTGTCTYTFGAVVDFKYEIKEGRIRMTLLQPNTNEVSTEQFLLEGDTLTLNPKTPESKQVMKRAGKSYEGTHPIVGDWTYPHYTGGIALMRYSRTGLVQLTVPASSLDGTYRIDHDSIFIEMQSQKPTSAKFKQNGNSLILIDAKNREDKYVRFDY
ncbi:MAG TPA: hypothetical protein VGP79_14980 [Bryobacteraceae bacterium]|nr:hypothetical protein [Bryobacteraceae bacterium]